VLTELNALRAARGEPSYAELTRTLIRQRVAEGQDPHAAHISKSSVHDAFRMGRTRLNLGLTRELVRVLGADPALVDHWLATPASAPTGADDEPEVPLDDPGQPVRQVLALMAGCLLLNLAGREFVDFFAFPIYLDMVGTAVVAITLGPWRGAAVGAGTNLIGAIGSGLISLPFAAVNIVGALVWGYGVRRWRLGNTLPRFFLLNVYTALACSAVAVPILLTLVGGQLRGGHDSITALVADPLGSAVAATAFSNVLTSSADKLISGFVALVIISALPAAFRRQVPLIISQDTPTPRL
jgi:energy-coupling factor transport system substrate-specific component